MVDDGRDKHVEYFAAILAPGSEPEPLRFRFNDLVRLHQELERLSELQHVRLPALPAKVTWWSMLRGGHSHGFQHRRSDQIHDFLARLCMTLRHAYGNTDEYVERCRPFSLLVRRGKVAARLQDERLLEQTLEEQERQAMEEFQTLLYDPELLGDALEEAEMNFGEEPHPDDDGGEAWDGKDPGSESDDDQPAAPAVREPPPRETQRAEPSAAPRASGTKEPSAKAPLLSVDDEPHGLRSSGFSNAASFRVPSPAARTTSKAPFSGRRGWDTVRGSVLNTKSTQNSVRISNLHGQRDAAVTQQQVLEWMAQVAGHKVPHAVAGAVAEQQVVDWLRTGVVLCDLVNAIKPGSVKKVNAGASLFKHIENITKFLDAALELGVPRADAFSASDLQQGKNIEAVIEFVIILGGVVQVSCPAFTGPKLGNPVQPDQINGVNRRSQASRLTGP